jgi:uncharacterized protein (DUF433 family)
MSPLDRITVDPEVCLGQPTIRHMRITVAVVLRLLGTGKTHEDVLRAYPELEREDILQCLRYAAWLATEQLRPIAAG